MNQTQFDFAKNDNVTPMMKQYLAIKANHPTCILFYRMGDFYEMFFEDAIIASNVLGIALTKRGKHENLDIPMCGVPYHSSELYLQNLISKGHKIAICEQIESPEEAKKRGYKSVVNREVVRIITPGTITEENLLNSRTSNYLMSIIKNNDCITLAYADISTGEVATSITDINHLSTELGRLNPVEILVSEQIYGDPQFLSLFGEYKKLISSQVSSFFEHNKALRRFKDYYKVILIDSFGDFTLDQVSAIGSLLEYVFLTQKQSDIRLNFPKSFQSQNFMIIDPATRRNLELTERNGNSKIDSSLLSVIDQSKTSMGGRLLYNYLSSPLLDPNIINSRLDMVEFFVENKDLLEELQNILSTISDTERSVSRVMLGRAGARELLSIKKDLIAFEKLKVFLYQNSAELIPVIENYLSYLGNFEKLIDLLENTIQDEPPLLLRDGGFIKKGYDKVLDELLDLQQNSSHKISELKQKYASQTGITNLKITKNNMLGYFIEITPSNLDRIDKDYFILRQSMVNGSRFTTLELKELEENIINAHGKIVNLELEIFCQVICEMKQYLEQISLAAQSIATIDVASSLANLAIRKNYCRPQITKEKNFILKDARHPVVEKFLNETGEEFTSNDTNFSENANIALLTGPNMAGKSTYLRQNVICAILAQMGSFVPASFAQIGIVDRVFSRVGASDDLAGGKSTFMVEMVETATILNQATDRSLVILDEIGRGTSTYDGLAIARSILEYIAAKINCRTIFATHYHELVTLKQEFSNIHNFTMDVKEWESKIIFLHKIIPGSANRSYGIHVAELAGLPKSVIKRANEILYILENSHINPQNPKITNLVDSELTSVIKDINMDEITPKQAQDLLYKLKNIVG